jgi:AraC-like DNA-binding protein
VLAVQQAFKHHYGKPILAYTLGKRIEWVKQLIGKGQLTIDFIAYEIGHANRSRLIKFFKKYVGCRPEDWRGRIT